MALPPLTQASLSWCAKRTRKNLKSLKGKACEGNMMARRKPSPCLARRLLPALFAANPLIQFGVSVSYLIKLTILTMLMADSSPQRPMGGSDRSPNLGQSPMPLQKNADNVHKRLTKCL